MTSRERIEAALNHREPDRTPIFEYVLQSPVADLLLGHPYAVTSANWKRLLEEKGWENYVATVNAYRDMFSLPPFTAGV